MAAALAPIRASAGRASRTIASASSSVDLARPPPRVDPREEARLGLPEVADAGQRALVEQGVADAAGGVVLAQAAQEGAARRTRRRRCPARARPAAGRSGCATRSSAPAPARRTARPSCSAVRITSQARRGERRQRSPRRYTPHFPPIRRCEWSVRSPSKRRNRCLPWASTDATARSASRSGQRSRRGAGAGSRSTRSLARPARRGPAWRRGGWCRPRASRPIVERSLG